MIFFQTFNGNFDQNSVEKQILFSAFVARYLRFVVGSTHGGACLRAEVSGIPRSRGLIFLIAEIVQFLRNIVFYPVVEPSFPRIIENIFFLFATTSALEPLSFSFFSKILLNYTVFASNSLYDVVSPHSLPLKTFRRKEVCNFAPKILY